jgi:hypothetical protein
LCQEEVLQDFHFLLLLRSEGKGLEGWRAGGRTQLPETEHGRRREWEWVELVQNVNVEVVVEYTVQGLRGEGLGPG